MLSKFNDLKVGTKISCILFTIITVVLLTFTWMLASSSTQSLEKRALTDMEEQTKGVVNMMDLFNEDMTSQVKTLGNILRGFFPDQFSADTVNLTQVGTMKVPTLKNGSVILNNNFEVIDKFNGKLGVNATVFVKSGSDFIRVTTSVRKENGERAIGTAMDNKSAAYAALSKNESFSGLAVIFGKKFYTLYDPIKNDKGEVIGVLYIGIDFTDALKLAQERISSIKLGKTGYFYVLNAKEGNEYGTYIIHPTKLGKNSLESVGVDGIFFNKEMIEKKTGTFTYLQKQDDGTAREKIAAVSHFKAWNWVIIGTTFSDEMSEDIVSLRNYFYLGAIIASLLLSSLLYFAVRKIITLPLIRATEAAKLLASGDLTTQVEVSNKDEIGQLLSAINGISHDLEGIIHKVREGTLEVSTASQQIALGSADLSARTEAQASSLEETASAMEQLTSTVKQNAENAQQANSLVLTASTSASKGGDVVRDAIVTMGEINSASKKIVDIISVIEGIAFQTNILALNAAVEAARAGEQGRGFAVVAAEVRTLAQRSSSAAKEIAGLINTSVKQIGTGTALVNSAGTVMQQIVSDVERVATIMNEVSAACSEQNDGIGHINTAITQMDSVTQQNAALVEETASAALAMQEQAESLTGVVSTFKLKE